MSAQTLSFIHHFVPAEDPSERTTLLLLHGTGGDENDLLDLGSMLHPTAALLSPRGQVNERGMARFFRRLEEGVFDEEDLRLRAGQLAEFVANACAEYGRDPSRVIGVGFSNGANIAGAVLLLHPGTLAGAALLSPMVPLVPEQLPQLGGTPVFIGAGRADPIAPMEETERLAALLRQAGAEVTLFWQPGGHGISSEEVRAAREWMSRVETDEP